jgi:hypothetical protein
MLTAEEEEALRVAFRLAGIGGYGSVQVRQFDQGATVRRTVIRQWRLTQAQSSGGGSRVRRGASGDAGSLLPQPGGWERVPRYHRDFPHDCRAPQTIAKTVRTMPSSRENSVWRWRWTKDSDIGRPEARWPPGRCQIIRRSLLNGPWAVAWSPPRRSIKKAAGMSGGLVEI